MLFGTSGIRGVANKKLTPEFSIKLGLALGTALNGGRVIVGNDVRLSSDMLKYSFISGLLATGNEVFDAGLAPTPAIALASKYYDTGVIITASHNPPEYNGFKFWKNGIGYSEHAERKIESLFFKKRFELVNWNKLKKVRKINILGEYVDTIVGACKIRRRFDIVVDCANSVASLVVPHIFIKHNVISINSCLDGRFPGRLPEPASENLFCLKGVVMDSGADLGIAYDGDADRFVVMNNKGELIGGDILVAIFSRYYLENGRGRKVIVTTIDASYCIDDVAREYDAEVVRTKVGDVAVAREIVKRDAVFGGEPSGSFIFPDVHLAPDGPLASLKFLEILCSWDLDELVKEIPRYFLIRDSIKCGEEVKEKIMNYVRENIGSVFDGDVINVDGVRVNCKGFWVLIRPSGTEPKIRVTVEAKSEERARKILKRAKKLVGEVD